MPSTDLITPGKDSPYAVLSMHQDELTELIQDNLAGQALTPSDLARIKVPAGGGTTWEVPTIKGTEAVKELVGVALRVDNRRAYWPGAYEGANDPPQCSSDNGLIGIGDPGGECHACPFNEWGSAGQEGSAAKACKEMAQVFLIEPGSILPMVLTIPPGSLKQFRQFRVGLLRAQLKLTDVEVGFALDKAASQKGITFSRVIPRVRGELDGAARNHMKALAELLVPAMDRAARVERSDLDDDA